MEDALSLAYRYEDRGFCAIPVPLASKKPELPGWPNLILTREELPNIFRPSSI